MQSRRCAALFLDMLSHSRQATGMESPRTQTSQQKICTSCKKSSTQRLSQVVKLTPDLARNNRNLLFLGTARHSKQTVCTAHCQSSQLSTQRGDPTHDTVSQNTVLCDNVHKIYQSQDCPCEGSAWPHLSSTFMLAPWIRTRWRTMAM